MNIEELEELKKLFKKYGLEEVDGGHPHWVRIDRQGERSRFGKFIYINKIIPESSWWIDEFKKFTLIQKDAVTFIPDFVATYLLNEWGISDAYVSTITYVGGCELLIEFDQNQNLDLHYVTMRVATSHRPALLEYLELEKFKFKGEK